MGSVRADGQTVLRMRAHGLPVSQGSKTYLGGGRMVESNAARLRPWRLEVKQAAREARTATLEGPVVVTLEFVFPRPRSHYGTGANAGRLKATAPNYQGVRPDIDKVTRAVLDSLTDAGWWRDDCQVAMLEVRKAYGDDPGVYAQAWEVTP